MLRLTKTQIDVLKRMKAGEVLMELCTPLVPYRCLGSIIKAERRYWLEQHPDRVRYVTFRVLFKRNLIQPLNEDGGLVAAQSFVLTDLGRKQVATARPGPA